jgi:hypothetical protein
MNPHLERFGGSLKPECLHRMILFGEKATRKAVNQYLEHYHTARCHQGLEHNVIVPVDRPPDVNAPLETMERHGGLLHPIAALTDCGTNACSRQGASEATASILLRRRAYSAQFAVIPPHTLLDCAAKFTPFTANRRNVFKSQDAG